MQAVMERPHVKSDKREEEFEPEPSIRERTIKAAKLFLEKRGYDVTYKWESESQLGFIVEDEGTLVFVHVVSNGLDKKGFPKDPSMTREEFERAAINWLSERGHDYNDVPVRFDEIALKVLCEDRALIRHSINVLGRD